MSTRRDRAAQAIIGLALDRGVAGELTTGELYRQADKVLAEIDRIPDVSEMPGGEVALPVRRDGEGALTAAPPSPEIETPRCPACGSTRWVSVSLDEGWSRRAQCVPCGAYHAPMIGYGYKSAHYGDPEHDHPAYRKSKTDDGVAAPGEAAPALATAAQPSGPVVTPIRQPRTFELYRHRDISGTSGTGVVAYGTQWSDGTVSVRWAGATPSFSNWDSLDILVAVHGHEGATEVRWLDGGKS